MSTVLTAVVLGLVVGWAVTLLVAILLEVRDRMNGEQYGVRKF